MLFHKIKPIKHLHHGLKMVLLNQFLNQVLEHFIIQLTFIQNFDIAQLTQ